MTLLLLLLIAAQAVLLYQSIRRTDVALELNDELIALCVERRVLLCRTRSLLVSDDCPDASVLLADIDRAMGR